MEKDLEVTRRIVGQTMMFDLKGDLSYQSEDVLFGNRDGTVNLEPGIAYVVFNFSQVSYINSLGIAVLIRMTRALLGLGCPVFAFGVTPHYQKLFRMVGLSEHMLIYPNEHSVIQRIGMQEHEL